MVTSAKLILTAEGDTATTRWLEARSLKRGFSVIQGGDKALFPRDKRIAVSNNDYSWRDFAKLLCGIREGWINESVAHRVEVEGEEGIRANILCLCWTYPVGKKRMIDWLLAQSEDTLNFLAHRLGNILHTDVLAFLAGFSELATQTHGHKDVRYVFMEEFSLKDLYQTLEKRLDAKAEADRQRRESILASFRNIIEDMVIKFSQAEHTSGDDSLIPSRSQVLRAWLTDYVIQHNILPTGHHQVYLNRKGIRQNLGQVDFDALAPR
jgi:hypothetical protein